MRKYPKRPKGTNQLAKLIVDIATGQKENDSPQFDAKSDEKGVEKK